MLTVRELLRDLDVRVLAGEAGLDLPVRWVHISELLDPTPWLSGGELLLSTGMQLDSPAQQREFIARLGDAQLSGLGFGTGFQHPTVPPALLEVAAERDFPVFEVPYEVPFIAITEAAFTQLVNEQYAVLRRAISAHERLERIVLSERGLDALAGALASLVGGSVLVFDGRGEPLVQRGFRRALDQDAVSALQAEVREHARRRDTRAFLPAEGVDGSRGLALPVAADGGGEPVSDRMPEAWLVALKDSGPLSDFDRLTLHQAVTIVALELLRGRVAGDTERRLAGNLLAAVVGGELAGAELARRLAPLGIADRVAAIVVERPDGGRGSAAPIEALLGTALRDDNAHGVVASTGSLTCALVAGLPDDELFAVARRVGERLAAGLDAPVRLGAGRAVPAGDAKRSFHEARCAVEALGFGLDGNGNGSGAAGESVRVATYRDLGSFQLLLSLQDDEALRLFCDSILGPIEAGDGHYGGELMRSLEAFIEENGQWERAAKRLYCHRHTLRYRIRRVEELTGRNLGSARDRIEFWLALRGRELVK
jgi:PucR family transcriptional regulator, purine catabolism regulatory protein